MKTVQLLPLLPLTLFAHITENYTDDIIVKTKQIYLDGFPEAHNPSIIKIDQGYLLTFRHSSRYYATSISQIGVVILDDDFEPITEPQLLNTRFCNSIVESQSEDARVFEYDGKPYLIFNDNLDATNFHWDLDKRDMFIAELHYSDGRFTVSPPLKLLYREKYSQLVQKNWIPFVKDEYLLLSYSVNPHEILYPNLKNGLCYPAYKTEGVINWNLGGLKGSTPALLVDGEYLGFCHSWIVTSSPSSGDSNLWHYFIGAYTFSPEPPFELTKMTPMPLIAKGFYTYSGYYKRVIFPGGFIVADPFIYMVYGKDDCEMWVATIDKEKLQAALVPIEKKG